MMRFFSPSFARVKHVLHKPPLSSHNRFISREGKYASFHAASPQKTEGEKLFSLAQRYMETDPPLAIQYLEDAAKTHTGAQSLLGEYYLKGMYVEKEEKKGISYLQLAAEKGDKKAMACLRTAAQQGDAYAQKALDTLFPTLSYGSETPSQKK